MVVRTAQCIAQLPNVSFPFPRSLSTPDRLKGKDAKPCGLDMLVTLVGGIKCLFWQQWNIPELKEPGMRLQGLYPLEKAVARFAQWSQ